MNELLKELNARIESGWMVEPQDVRRMLKHNTDCERNFPTWLYMYMDLWQMTNDFYLFYKQALGGTIDLAALKAIACGVIGTCANDARNLKMPDLMNVLYRAIPVINGIQTHENMATFIRTLQRYIVVLFYAVDAAMPWDPMCKAYTELMKTYVPVTREKAWDIIDR